MARRVVGAAAARASSAARGFAPPVRVRGDDGQHEERQLGELLPHELAVEVLEGDDACGVGRGVYQARARRAFPRRPELTVAQKRQKVGEARRAVRELRELHQAPRPMFRGVSLLVRPSSDARRASELRPRVAPTRERRERGEALRRRQPLALHPRLAASHAPLVAVPQVHELHPGRRPVRPHGEVEHERVEPEVELGRGARHRAGLHAREDAEELLAEQRRELDVEAPRVDLAHAQHAHIRRGGRRDAR